jgi:hypothetical protein
MQHRLRALILRSIVIPMCCMTAMMALMVLSGPAGAMPVGETQGVRLQQLDFKLRTITVASSSTGRVEIDAIRLRRSTGIGSGYLNVATARGWVVRNVPIAAETSDPYGKLAARFNLGVANGTRVQTLDAAIDFSPTLLTAFNGPRSAQAVTSRRVTPTGGGGGGSGAERAPAPPEFDDIVFGGGPGPGDEFSLQLDHPNIETAVNQCVPMSVANSLQFLANSTGLKLPHEHKPGLTPSVSPGDDSLVGQIEQAMNRTVTDRATGEITDYGDGIAGKLRYLAQHGLSSRIEVTHWTAQANDRDRPATAANGVTAKSTYKGKVDLPALLQATKDGQNCEVDLTFADGSGGHAIELVGMGRTRGNWWIKHASDIEQGSDEEGAGPDGMLFDYLKQDAAGNVSLSTNDERIAVIVCERVLPPPSTVLILELIDPRGHICCVDAPPSAITVIRNGSSVTMTGNASWLPLTGTLGADGRFDLQSTATVAGRTNVRSKFSGTFSQGRFDGSLSVGTQGELFGVPISWRLQVIDPVVGTAPAMRVNGFRRDVAIRARDAVQPSVSMRAGAQLGQAVDWWLVVATADGQLFSFDLASKNWQPGLKATLTAPLVDLPPFALPSFEGLPAGQYSFYFGIDASPNGLLDLASAVYEKTVLTIRP